LPRAIAEHDQNVDVVGLLSGLVNRDDAHSLGGALTLDDFSPHRVEGAASVPIYAYGGWFDAALARSAIRQYLANRNPFSRLRLGPWFHAGTFNASPDANGNSKTFDHAREVIRFFDYQLRGLDPGFTADAPVQYYTMGEERWKSARVWPPPGARVRSLFLGADRALTTQPSVNETAADRYVVDTQATTGSGSRWGLIVGTGLRRGYTDRREADRHLLTYTTPPLSEDMEVTGHPVVHLFLSANATDGAVLVYLEDVRPNGEVRYLTEGELRLRHRQLRASPIAGDPVPFHSYLHADEQPVVPGDMIEVVVDLLPTSYLFRAGDAVRLAIAGADTASFEVPLPSSGLIYDIHRDRVGASRLELPTYQDRQ
jgi:putative CocE/NonD family hydrolase